MFTCSGSNVIDHLPIEDRFKIKIKSDVNYILTKNIPDLQKIVLFGSCAKGTAKNKSDVDLLFVVSENIPDRALRSEVYTDLDDRIQGVSTDAKFCTQNALEKATDIFSDEVNKYGILLWEKSNHLEDYHGE